MSVQRLASMFNSIRHEVEPDEAGIHTRQIPRIHPRQPLTTESSNVSEPSRQNTPRPPGSMPQDSMSESEADCEERPPQANLDDQMDGTADYIVRYEEEYEKQEFQNPEAVTVEPSESDTHDQFMTPVPFFAVDSEQPDLYVNSRASLEKPSYARIMPALPRINTNISPEFSFPSRQSSESRINELEMEVRRLSKELQTTKDEMSKKSISSFSPVVNASLNQAHEYIEQPELTRTNTQKTSPIDIATGVRAKKIIIMLDDNWCSSDEIYLFGFSHGAFAARAIAALITEIGLVNKAGMASFDTLYDTYFDPKYGKVKTTDDYETWREACQHLAYEISRGEGVVLSRVSVRFLGCLDTIGWSNYEGGDTSRNKENEKLWKRGYFNFHHLLLHEDVEYAFHALALDEDRLSHAPLLMYRPKDSRRKLSQVWFTGSHINIGGGQLTHELAKNLPFLKPNPNELSDIIFLHTITECHEFLTFSKKHINRAVAEYMNIQAEPEIDESTYKDHWVAAKIDEAWSETVNAHWLTHVRDAALPRRKHIRTPLRYRPHWFQDESWSRYSSCEFVHGSARYRTRHHPKYIPKALVGYRCVKTCRELGVGEQIVEQPPPKEEIGPRCIPHKIKEKFYYDGVESSKNKLYSGENYLPVLLLTAFEVLSAGGRDLLNGFGFPYSDIYRESPPVFKFAIHELRNMQEGWVFHLEAQSPTVVTPIMPMSVDDKALALKNANARNLQAINRYHGLCIKQQGAYENMSTQETNKTEQRTFSGSSNFPGPENQLLNTKDSEGTPFRNTQRDFSRRGDSSYRDKGIMTDESGTGKGKGKHSSYSHGYDNSYDDTDRERDSEKSKSGRFRFFGFKRSVSRKRQDSRPRLHQSTFVARSTDRFLRQQRSSRHRRGTRSEDLDFDRGRVHSYSEHKEEMETKLNEPVEPSRVPLEPEWARRLNEKGVVHPCKYKHGRKR
ncbi:hypothetical protein ABW20_dc0100856 [Dactylellina cionopaga]|nr:hypothetical protein ABW20_dc0100856 [Dactylellina cionopaga]